MKSESKKSMLGKEALKNLTAGQLASVAAGESARANRNGWGDGTPSG